MRAIRRSRVDRDGVELRGLNRELRPLPPRPRCRVCGYAFERTPPYARAVYDDRRGGWTLLIPEGGPATHCERVVCRMARAGVDRLLAERGPAPLPITRCPSSGRPFVN